MFYFTFVIRNVLDSVSNFIKLSNLCVFLGNVYVLSKKFPEELFPTD